MLARTFHWVWVCSHSFIKLPIELNVVIRNFYHNVWLSSITKVLLLLFGILSSPIWCQEWPFISWIGQCFINIYNRERERERGWWWWWCACKYMELSVKFVDLTWHILYMRRVLKCAFALEGVWAYQLTMYGWQEVAVNQLVFPGLPVCSLWWLCVR